MSQMGWWLVDVVSRGLEPHERDAVRGDLTESGETAGLALRGVMGLVARRQAALWKDWRPWAVLTLLIVPLGLLLSVVSRITAGQSATYTWLYANNWDWALFRYAEFWYELRDSIASVFMSWLPLVCWSWTAGLVIGSVSRRLIPTNAVLFCLALLLGGLFGAPSYLAYWLRHVEAPGQNDPVSALAFYREVLPLIVQAVLVAVPALWGMRQGAGLGRLPVLLRSIIWTAAMVALSVMVMREPGVGFLLAAYRHPNIWQSWQIRVLEMVMYWPAAYLISNAIARRWRRIHA